MNDENYYDPSEVSDEPSYPAPAVVQPEQSIDQMLTQRTGGSTGKVLCSYDANTAEGKMRLMRHVQADTPKGTKDAWLNREFSMVGYTMRTVVCTKDATGATMENPKILIRSIMETAEGDLIPSASDYLAQDLRMIDQVHGGVSPDKPVLVMIRKGGAADRLIDVQASRPTQVGQLPPKKSKAAS